MTIAVGAICLAFIIWFAFPLVVFGVLNIGNITGMSAFALIFVLFALRSRIKSAVLTVAVVAFLLVAVLVVVESGLMIRAAAKTPPEDATVVVLGCQVKGTRPSLMLRERIDAAEEYLKAHPDAKCIVSGGKGEDEEISEALCMYNAMVEDGIDPERIYMEDKSVSTMENIKFSMEIIKREGLSDNLAIVTNEFHEYRAAYVADKCGAKAYAIPARTSGGMFATFYVRELYGIIFEWFLR